MSYNYRGNQVFGRVTFGHIIIKEGIPPNNSVALADIKAGVAVSVKGIGGKGAFKIVSNPTDDLFIGVLEEMFEYSKDSYKVVKAKGDIRMNVRSIATSGIVAGDSLTISDGRFIKAKSGDLIVALAYTDAVAVGDDEVVNVTFEMYSSGVSVAIEPS